MCYIIPFTAPCRRGCSRILFVHDAPKEDGGEQKGLVRVVLYFSPPFRRPYVSEKIRHLPSARTGLNHQPKRLVSLEPVDDVRVDAVLVRDAVTSCSLLHHLHTLVQ